MKIFDTHTHYDDKVYGGADNRRKFLSSLLEDSVAGFIAIGCNAKRNRLALEIANEFEEAYCVVGIHPLDVESVRDSPAYLAQIREQIQANRRKVAGIGETGLPRTTRPRA